MNCKPIHRPVLVQDGLTKSWLVAEQCPCHAACALSAQPYAVAHATIETLCRLIVSAFYDYQDQKYLLRTNSDKIVDPHKVTRAYKFIDDHFDSEDGTPKPLHQIDAATHEQFVHELCGLQRLVNNIEKIARFRQKNGIPKE